MNPAIVCDGKELETYDVKQEGTSSLTAFVASEAGKVSTFPLRLTHCEPNTAELRSSIHNYILEQFKRPSVSILYLELLRAQGIIPLNDKGQQGFLMKIKKRCLMHACTPAELDALKVLVQSSISVKLELGSPSPIVVKRSGEVVDLTLDD